jgi:hypothetical protein
MLKSTFVVVIPDLSSCLHFIVCHQVTQITEIFHILQFFSLITIGTEVGSHEIVITLVLSTLIGLL